MATAKSQKLEDQAASAALYVTQGKDKSKKPSSVYPLDKDGKLSSAGAATSLKHATPKELPSYPSSGLANMDSASGAAASLANANQKPFEHWKPGEIPAANRAAMLAKDHKAPDLWQPELSAAGSKAALLAQRDGGNVEIWRPEDTDAGHSAAGQAMRKKGLSPQVGESLSAEAGKRALVAATGAVSGSRKRADSSPITTPAYPDAANSAANALKAANSVSRRPAKTGAAPAPATTSQIDAARIHNQAVTNLSREMYTSHPPVAPEIEEQNKQAGLRAAAVSMAKRMYELQQKQIAEAAERSQPDSQYAASTVHHRSASSASSDDSIQPPKYTNLQEAAKKLAAERLAKLHDEHAAYRTYYGTQAEPHSRKLSVRGRTRRRASSESELNDEERAQQVRAQMSLFSDKLAQVDLKKRQTDRDLLMAAAQRNVKARMSGMDEKVFNETGKVSPAMMEEWEAKAKAKAQAESEVRMVNHGKVHIGGGKFLDQSEVDAIAAAKVQPTLDEITETAEKHRARDEELRQQQLERERLAAEKAADEKERADKTKEEWRRYKDEEKREKQAKKDEAQAKKDEAKAKKAEEKRKAKEEKTLTKPGPATAGAGTGTAATLEEAEVTPAQGQEPPITTDKPASDAANTERSSGEDNKLEKYETAETGGDLTDDEEKDLAASAAENEIKPVETTTEEEKPKSTFGDTTAEEPVIPGSAHETPLSTRIAPPVAASPAAIPKATVETTVTGPSKSPKEKEPGKVTSWLKSKLRRTSKATKPEQTSTTSAAAPESDKVKTAGITGGTTSAPTENSGPTNSDLRDDSMREVAMAGKDAEGTDFAGKPGTAAAGGISEDVGGDTNAPVVSPTSENLNAELYDNDSDEEEDGGHRRRRLRESTSSPEISSLSSDEDPRGRSSVRLADSMNLPTNESAQQPTNKRAGMVVPDLPADALAAAAASGNVPLPPPTIEETDVDPATAGAAKEGVSAEEIEATEEEKLAPPPAIVPAAAQALEPRASASPKRDSRFVEAL